MVWNLYIYIIYCYNVIVILIINKDDSSLGNSIEREINERDELILSVERNRFSPGCFHKQFRLSHHKLLREINEIEEIKEIEEINEREVSEGQFMKDFDLSQVDYEFNSF